MGMAGTQCLYACTHPRIKGDDQSKINMYKEQKSEKLDLSNGIYMRKNFPKKSTENQQIGINESE